MRKRIHLMPAETFAAVAVEPKYVGIWIDRAKAQIITMQGSQTMTEVAAATEGPEASRDWDAKRFYRQVVERIGDAEELLIAGPSEVQDEFRREFIRHAPLSKRLAEVHSDDALTPRQLRARVKRFFESRHKGAAPAHGTAIAV